MKSFMMPAALIIIISAPLAADEIHFRDGRVVKCSVVQTDDPDSMPSLFRPLAGLCYTVDGLPTVFCTGYNQIEKVEYSGATRPRPENFIRSFNIATGEFEKKAARANVPDPEGDTMLRFYLGLSGIDINIDRYDDEHLADVQYSPELGSHVGVELMYRSFVLTYQKQLEASSAEQQLVRKTDYTDVLIAQYRDLYAIEASYQRYSGFRLEYPEKYGYSETSPETDRQDLTLYYTGLSFIYSIASVNDFSLANTFKQYGRYSEWFTCAFLVMVSVNHVRFESDYELVPPSVRHLFNEFGGLQSGSFTTLGIAPGGSMTVTILNFYGSLTMLFGGGYEYQRFRMTGGSSRNHTSFFKGNIRMSLGFNSRYLLIGSNVMFDLTDATLEEWKYTDTAGSEAREVTASTSIVATSFRMELFAGFRF